MRNFIEKNSREVYLRIIYAELLKDKLGNKFKAVFELLNSKNLKPSLFQKFEIFRMQSDIEHSFIVS